MTDVMDQGCRAVMSTDPVVIGPKETIGKATELMLKHRVLSLPVVDEGGRYLGMFLKSRLLALLMPKALTADAGGLEMSRVDNVGFISESLKDVHERFAGLASRTVDTCLDTESPVMRPETPLINALFLIHRHHNFLPVVDGASGRLVGVVSTWDAIGHVASGK